MTKSKEPRTGRRGNGGGKDQNTKKTNLNSNREREGGREGRGGERDGGQRKVLGRSIDRANEIGLKNSSKRPGEDYEKWVGVGWGQQRSPVQDDVTRFSAVYNKISLTRGTRIKRVLVYSTGRLI